MRWGTWIPRATSALPKSLMRRVEPERPRAALDGLVGRRRARSPRRPVPGRDRAALRREVPGGWLRRSITEPGGWVAARGPGGGRIRCRSLRPRPASAGRMDRSGPEVGWRTGARTMPRSAPLRRPGRPSGFRLRPPAAASARPSCSRRGPTQNSLPAETGGEICHEVRKMRARMRPRASCGCPRSRPAPVCRGGRSRLWRPREPFPGRSG